MNSGSNAALIGDQGDNIEHKNWFIRTFSKMGKDSLRGSILVMLLTALGTGIFTLHHLFDKIGILLAYACIVVFGLFYYLSADMLIYSVSTRDVHSKSINELIKTTLGRVWGLFYDLVFLVYLVLALIAQLLSISGAFYNNFKDYVWEWFKIPIENRNEAYFNFYFCFIAGFFLFFINVKQSIDEFRYFSLVSFSIFLYIVIVCLVQSPAYYNDLKANHQDVFKLYDFNLENFLMNYGLLLFAYNCITNFFGVVATVHNPSQRRLRKIFRRTFITLAVIFIVFGTASYLSLGSNKADHVQLFIFRDPIGTTDYFMIVGRSLLILSLCVGSGLTVYPLKMMSYDLLGIQQNNLTNFALSLFFTVLSVTIGANFTGIKTYVSIAGAFSATLIAFTFPGICGLKTNYAESQISRLLLTLWIIVVTVMGFYGSYLAIGLFKK